MYSDSRQLLHHKESFEPHSPTISPKSSLKDDFVTKIKNDLEPIKNMPSVSNTSAAGLISLLGESGSVVVFALNGLLACVDVDWPVVAEAVGQM